MLQIGSRRRYPRREIKIDISHLRRNGAAVIERSRLDQITVTRGGKPILVLMRWEAFRALKQRAGENVKTLRPTHSFRSIGSKMELRY